MRGSWNHSASMIGFTFCHVSCLHSTLCVLADHLYYHGCVDRELRVGQKYCMQPLLLLQGEKSAALVGCTTVSGQANPHSIQKKGFPEEKLVTGDLAGKNMQPKVSNQNAFGQDSGQVLANFALIFLHGADGAVWMHDSGGLEVMDFSD